MTEKKHEQEVRQANHQCTICPAFFSAEENLRIHQTTHHSQMFEPLTYGEIFPQTIPLRKQVSKKFLSKLLHPLTILGLPGVQSIPVDTKPKRKKGKKRKKPETQQ